MRLLVLLPLVVACGFQAPTQPLPGDEPDAGTVPDPTVDAGPGTLTPRSFIAQLITEECVQAFACKPQYPANATKSFDTEWGTDPNDCLTTDRDYEAIAAIEAAVAAGTITFDPVQAEACLVAPGIPADCAKLFAENYDWASSCYAGLAGHVANGGACTTTWECSSTSYCGNSTCKASN